MTQERPPLDEWVLIPRKEALENYGLIDSFEPWMIDKVREHLEDGWSFSSFSGKYHITADRWARMPNDVPELKLIRDQYNYWAKRKGRVR